MNIDRKVLTAAALVCAIAAVILVWGMLHRESYSFESKNIEAWVEHGLSQEFTRLIESGNPLQIEQLKVGSPDGLTYDMLMKGRLSGEPVTAEIIATTRISYDEIYDSLRLVLRGRPRCTVREDGATVSRQDATVKLCGELTSAITESLYRTPIRIDTHGSRGQLIHVYVREHVDGGTLLVSLMFLRFLWWMWFCVAVFPLTILYMSRHAHQFSGPDTFS
jgi:hypothetical protein